MCFYLVDLFVLHRVSTLLIDSNWAITYCIQIVFLLRGLANENLPRVASITRQAGVTG